MLAWKMLRSPLPEYGHEDARAECKVCVSRGIHNNRHRHFSSAYHREISIAVGRSFLDCPICQTAHPTQVTGLLKAIFTSSTLHNTYRAESWRGTVTEKGAFHVDMESICGGTIAMGITLWERTYGNITMNIDTHIVMGINDILRLIRSDSAGRVRTTKQKVSSFMKDLQMWYNITVDHSTRHGLHSPNRFSVSRLIKPPQLYHLPGNKDQHWLTHNNLINGVNLQIEQFNQSIQFCHGDIDGRKSTVAGLANIGIRKNKGGMKEHQARSWREKKMEKKLHLGNSLQAKSLRMCVRFLATQTPIPPNQYHQPPNPSSAIPTPPSPPIHSPTREDSWPLPPSPLPMSEESFMEDGLLPPPYIYSHESLPPNYSQEPFPSIYSKEPPLPIYTQAPPHPPPPPPPPIPAPQLGSNTRTSVIVSLPQPMLTNLLSDIRKGTELRPVVPADVLPEQPDIMAEIRMGKALRPTVITTAPPASRDPPTLLDQIKQGIRLRPVAEREKEEAAPEKKIVGLGIANLMNAAMAGRRTDLGMSDEETEDDGEHDWEEDIFEDDIFK